MTINERRWMMIGLTNSGKTTLFNQMCEKMLVTINERRWMMIGLTNSGKTTLFNQMCEKNPRSKNFPETTFES